MQMKIDAKLAKEAMKLGAHQTQKEAIHAALEHYIRCKKRIGTLKLSGKIDWDPNYDYKALRKRKRNGSLAQSEIAINRTGGGTPPLR